MAGTTLGGRALAGGAIALPLALLLIGTGGGLIFDPNSPWALRGAPYWILVVWGLVELALLVAVWIPYLHRVVGAVICVDALFQGWAYAAAGRSGYVVMYGIMAVLGAAIALLWSSTPVALAEARARWARRPRIATA
jgi:hypothetical protein